MYYLSFNIPRRSQQLFMEHIIGSVGLKLCFIKYFLGCKQMKSEKKMDQRKMMMRNQGNESLDHGKNSTGMTPLGEILAVFTFN